MSQITQRVDSGGQNISQILDKGAEKVSYAVDKVYSSIFAVVEKIVSLAGKILIVPFIKAILEDPWVQFIFKIIATMLCGVCAILCILYPPLCMAVLFGLGTMYLITTIRQHLPAMVAIKETVLFIKQEKTAPSLGDLILEVQNIPMDDKAGEAAFVAKYGIPEQFLEDGTPKEILTDALLSKLRSKNSCAPLRYPMNVGTDGPYECAEQLLVLKHKGLDLNDFYQRNKLQMGDWQQISDRLTRFELQKAKAALETLKKS